MPVQGLWKEQGPQLQHSVWYVIYRIYCVYVCHVLCMYAMYYVSVPCIMYVQEISPGIQTARWHARRCRFKACEKDTASRYHIWFGMWYVGYSVCVYVHVCVVRGDAGSRPVERTQPPNTTSACMCVGMYAHTYKQDCIHICMWVCKMSYSHSTQPPNTTSACMCVGMYAQVCMLIHTSRTVYMYVCMYVCMWVCMYVCMYVCMWICKMSYSHSTQPPKHQFWFSM